MRRALDTARSKLDSLNDRDAILDCYFEQAQRLFQFAVLFVVKGDTAHGRAVHGLGAPDGLVSRLAFPLGEPGLLHRARELRRPFVGGATNAAADEQLFGSLGRVMPSVLVVPLVVRAKVVAIILGDGPAELLNDRAQEAGRPTLDIAKEEMLLWSESVSEALERLILKKKSAAGGSVPPPRPSWGAPKLPAGITDVRGGFALPAPPSLESFHDDGAPQPEATEEVYEEAAPAPAEPEAPPRSRRAMAIAVVAAAALVAIAGGAWLMRGDPDAERIVLKGDKLAGWPNAVDPMTALEPARGASGLGGHPDLASIRAEIGAGGRVNFGGPARAEGPTLLTFSFVTKDGEADVRIDSAGVHAARASGVKRCDREACRPVAPPPQCSFEQIWAAALTAGVLPTDRALVTYGVEERPGVAAAPEWLISVGDRGSARIDAATCKVLPHERLRPPSLALAAVPGAPKDVDPLAIVDLARGQSGLDADAVLLEIDARGVGANGHVDLSGEDGITYTFSDPLTVKTKPRLRVVKVDKNGMPVTSAESDREQRPSRFFGTVTPPARCSFVHAFKTLGNLPAGTTAHITYGPDTASTESGQWKMDVASTGLSRRLSDGECAAWEKLSQRK